MSGKATDEVPVPPPSATRLPNATLPVVHAIAGRGPGWSCQEVMDWAGLKSKSTTHQALVALRELGLVAYGEGRARGTVTRFEIVEGWDQ